MFKKMVRTVFGDPLERALSQYREVVERINTLESEMQGLSDDALRSKTEEFRERLKNGETLSDLLDEAFAVVREASVRTTGMRHYDVQMIGGIVLHEGRIAEMKTGEGKTLVATLPMYLNALTGKGAHLVTPNDYLSKYGLQSMGPIYHFLGLSAAVIQNAGTQGPDAGSFLFDPDFQSDDDRYQHLRNITRREAYKADVLYGTNNEFGFDYLRDNMALSAQQLTQRELHYAIIDEVDNILIDEARTPLIISGPADKPSDNYRKFSDIVKRLKPSSQQSVDDEEPDGDYVVDIKDRISYLTDQGVEKIERILGVEQLYHPDHSDMIPYLDNCLRAQALYHRDKEYMVVDGGEVVIIDDFTGRPMPGRRFSEGLHQAIEAKEGVEIKRENVTMANITFQNFFRMYDKLAGMTGTALTEGEEFEKTYELDVVPIPTNVPVVREDKQDLIYMSEKAKWDAIVEEIRERHAKGQPVLVGTVAVETSERLGKFLSKAGIPHAVLNAKQHEREASVITQAGRPGAVTIATNMAGRGVDILLGGNPEGLAREMLRKEGIDVTEATPEQWQAAFEEAKKHTDADKQRVKEAGGLFVLGTERHEARRIDNQLRGRAGRQGDPGESRFYLSLEDDLMRRFNGEQVKKFMSWANLPDDAPIEHNMITKSIEQAQVRVEGQNFDIRKNVLEYDDVVNRQREVIYKRRLDWLDMEADAMRNAYLELVEDRILGVLDDHTEPGDDLSTWDDEYVELLYKDLLTVFPVPEAINPDTMRKLTRAELEAQLLAAAANGLTAKERELEEAQEGLAAVAYRQIMLRTIDRHWQRHLTDLDMLREGIGLRAIAQEKPITAYQREGFQMFGEMQGRIDEEASRTIFMVRPQPTTLQPQQRQMRTARPGVNGSDTKAAVEPIRKKQKLGRNDPCWCGSGKKYKHCHLKEDKEKAAVPQ
jgi:preprotein translocase subunit SecA